MSHKAYEWALDLHKAGVNVGPTAKHVLLMLAYRADDGARSWPSVKRLADEGDLSERAVQKALRALEVAGLVAGIKRAGTSTLYYLPSQTERERAEARALGELPPGEGGERGAPPRERGGVNVVHPGGERGAPKYSLNTQTEECTNARSAEAPQLPLGDTPPPATKPAAASKPPKAPDGIAATRFDEWWRSYPRKTAKPRAEKAYLAALKAGAREDRLIDALATFDWPDNPDYIPYPASWLNARRWEDRPAERTRSASGGELHGNF